MIKQQRAQPEGPNKIRSDILVAEFSALRDEMLFRMRSADFAAFSAMTVTVSLSGIALSYTASFSAIILVAPYISTFAMHVYTSHLRAVKLIASYLRGPVRADALRIAASSVALGWETYLIESTRKSTWHLPSVDYPTAAFVMISQIFALILGFQHRGKESANTIIWLIGICVTLWSVFMWCRLETQTKAANKEFTGA